ncbi:hypothetical protein ACB376_08630 [Klebsiella electrica]|uniref:hypothetical protein n=1 Tax=Klebsiella variicola TaxID=244366 RepID=UPI003EDA1FB6
MKENKQKKTIVVTVRLSTSQVEELARLISTKELKPGPGAAIQYLINQSMILN